MNLSDVLSGCVGSVFDYTDDLAVSATFIKYTPSSYDPVTGTETTTSVSTSVKALMLKYRDSLVDGTMVLRDDYRCIIPYSSLTPDLSDEITVSNVVYRIVGIRGDILHSYWDMQIRKK